MGSNFFKVRKGINVGSNTTSVVSALGDVAANSSTNKTELHNGTTASPLVTEAHSATLTNKTLDNTTVEAIKDSNLSIENSSDTTKVAQFSAASITTGTTRTYTLPDASTTVVGTNVAQTLTNKTLSGNTATNLINGIGVFDFNSSGTLTAPNTTDTIAVLSSAQTFSNKTLDNTTILTIKDSNFTVQDDADTTKQAQLELSSITTGTTRTFTLPDANTTVVGTGVTQTLTNKSLVDTSTSIVNNSDNTKTIKFDASANGTGISTTLASTAATSNKTLTLPNATDTLVARSTTDTLTNKSLIDTGNQFINNSDNTKLARVDCSGITTGNTRVFTFPDLSDTLVTKTSTDTGSGRLQNKDFDDSNTEFVNSSDTTKKAKFSAASITTGTTRTYTLPDASTTLVGTAVTQTLTNKTFGDAETLTQIVTPSNPASGFDKIYVKNDDKLYILTSAGVETAVGGTAPQIAKANGSVGSTAANTAIVLPTQVFATGVTYNNSTGEFTVPATGYARVSCYMQFGNGNIPVYVWLNGVKVTDGILMTSDPGTGAFSGANPVAVTSGDKITIRANSTTGTIDSTSWMSVEMIH